ncbi:hypothetical protein O5700_09005, partial [Escherichia coli]|nr:hypothetical protein [Escherichia coli]
GGSVTVTGKNFAVGSDAKIWDADKSMAVGHKTAVFNADNSVALGYGSQVNGESNVLSVGAGPSGYGFSVDGAPETRRIINVSDGVKDSDAATKGQMDNAIADAVRVSGDALRGEIGGVYRDARAHTDSQVSQALAHKTLSEPLTGTIWFDNGTQSLESASVIDRNGNAN